MAEEKSGGGGSLLGNPSALLALVTIAGGLWLVSQKLTSDRPVTPAGDSKDFFGDQKLEARLWEDPFRPVPRESAQRSVEGTDALGVLGEQIRRRSEAGKPSASSNPSQVGVVKRALILPVMISGGQYSEDQESRIRSRFAIVSALSRAGYAPEDAEHLGDLEIPWPTQQEVEQAKQNTPEGSFEITRLWDRPKATGAKPRYLGLPISDLPARRVARYEWYRPRVFSVGSGNNDSRPNVLVLWLDDSYFEDDPLIRLPLLLEQLTDVNVLPPGTPQPRVALVGPRRSSTLRSMLPLWQSDVQPLTAIANRSLAALAKKVINRIELFSATPSAMDEVLVNNPTTPDLTPRISVRDKLLEAGFKSFHNFSATDAQIAHEIFGELALRGADLKDEKKHVVLISEWDTFYARMLSLTYGAELAVRQKSGRSGSAFDRNDFIKAYVSGVMTEPSNFHSFVYLRGLDGQTVGGNNTADEGGSSDRRGKSAPTSVEELRHWEPDVNKAEGQAQFDYLGRLGDRIADLQKALKREDGGKISAVGIVGSDVYDTLLILQALRGRFPATLFFTTDLDVRFLHPRERDWARNLIVASSYGLALHDSLQGTVTPFRDSTQTAQFIATLAALGGDRQLNEITRIPVRRFEVGNRMVMDLSVESSELVTSPAHAGDLRRWLHPLTASEKDRWYPAAHDLHPLWWSLLVAFLLLAGASWSWIPLRRMTWEGLAYPRKALDYSEEDIGGPDGVGALLRGLDNPNLPEDRIGQWIVSQSCIREAREELKTKPVKTPGEVNNWERERILASLTAMVVKLLNQLLRQERLSDGIGPPSIPLLAISQQHWIKRLLRWWPQVFHLSQIHEARLVLDAYLDKVASPFLVLEAAKPDSAPSIGEKSGGIRGHWKNAQSKARHFLDTISGDDAFPRCAFEERPLEFEQAALQTAVAARGSAVRIFRLRCRGLAGFWAGSILSVFVTIAMIRTIWCDTFKGPEGEPFSLVSGTSAWPAEALRLLVFALAICFSFGLSHKLREAFLSLTRSFHFSLPPTNEEDSTDRVCAQSIWYTYRQDSRFRKRLGRVCLIIPLYILLLFAIGLAIGESIASPVRGSVTLFVNSFVVWLSLLGFLLLAFFTVDAARLCREFIEKISAGPTRYPAATRRHFSRQKGGIDVEYLDEWIDLQLIAELTEQVGRLVYYPAGLVLLLILARNSWWDAWAWPVSLVAVFTCNFVLALTSVIILQTAAREAKRKAEASLAARIKKLQAQVAPSKAQNNATQAENLLDEIHRLDRGAFVPFWNNPVVGALFLSSGGTTALQVFIWFMGR
jgi:hypothetical protein